jgi:hypothetical protein
MFTDDARNRVELLRVVGGIEEKATAGLAS